MEQLDDLLELINDDLRSKIAGILQLEEVKAPVIDKIEINEICLKVRQAMDLFESAWEQAFILTERLIAENKNQ